MSLLMAISIGTVTMFYFHNARQRVFLARQAVIMEDCRVVQNEAAAYRKDLGTAPRSIDDLIAAGYLKALPRDFSSGGCKW
jgi:general secretion pathway protein G